MVLSILTSLLVSVSRVKAVSDYNIVGLGDSIMMGYGVSENENVFSLVTGNLKTRFSTKANVVGENLGVDGADSTALLFKLNRDNGFIKSIKDAELIEINIGGNDGLLYMTDYIMTKLDVNDDITKLITDKLAEQGKTYDGFIAETIAAINKKYPGGLTEAETQMLLQEEIAKLDINFFSVFEGRTTELLGLNYSVLNTKMTESANNFSKTGGNWEQIISKIRALNSQADVIVTTTFNPYKSLSSILKIIGSNISPTVDIVCRSVNDKIIAYATTGKYTVNDIESTFSSIGGMLLTGIVNSDPHPNANGHKMIYTLQKTALSNLAVKVVTPPTTNTTTTTNEVPVNNPTGGSTADVPTQGNTTNEDTSTCKNRETTVSNLMSRITDRGSKQLAVLDNTYKELLDYRKTDSDLLSGYQTKVDSITAKQTEAQISVQSLSQYSSSFSCDGNDPKSQINVFLETAKTQNDKLMIYKDAIVDLISSIKLSSVWTNSLVGVNNYGA